MADAAVEFLLGNLTQLLVYNANLISNVKDQVDSLCNDLRLLAAFVKQTTESRNKDIVIKELVRQIRVEVYKAEDIVDMYVFNVSIQKSRTTFVRAFHIPDYAVNLRNVGKLIEGIRGRVKEINGNKLFANEYFRKTESFTRRPPSVEEDNVVGFDKEAEKLVNWLKADTKDLEVVSVVGMGGLGKTTLVKKVLDPSSCISIDPNVFRRVSVHSRVSDYISSKPDSSRVRSFLSYGNEEKVLNTDLITYFPGSFSLLRVLDVGPISFPRFPSIRLVHLRYIALLGTFKALPAVISNLWNLQTLIVKTNLRNIDVQADIWKLLQLRHVYTSAASDLPTPSTKSLKGGKVPLLNENLRTMSKVSPNSCTDVILARTPNLQKLGVRGNLTLLLELKKGSCKFDNIAKLSNLEKLKLLNDTYPIPPSDGKLRGLPEWYKFPKKLKKLTLSDTMLDWEHMSVLGNLKGLEVLKLGDNAFLGERWETPDGSFAQLRVLQIGKTDLVHWEASSHHFPQLQRVVLTHCEHLDKIPSGLGEIPKLKVVELSWTSPSAISSARLIQKNFKLLVFPPDQETQT